MPLVIPDFLRPLLASPVAVFGGGVSGQAVVGLVRKLGANAVIFDEKSIAAGVVNNFSSTTAEGHRLVIFSPGFPSDHPWLNAARAGGCECLGELDFAALFWRGSVVAVTGTNGKTTLTEFLVHALRAAGRDARATGNIGYSFSQLVAETDGGDGGGADSCTAVCEVSSFQAETLRHFRADAVLWTNFAEDHLERHPGMEAYFRAKWNLVAYAEAAAVFVGASVQAAAAQYGLSLPAVQVMFSEEKTPDSRLASTVFAREPQHENFLLAAAWWHHAGLPEETLYAAARSFRLGRHRLARVAEIDGVTWWNDSKATNFHAVEAALAAFEGQVLLIAGGKAKGGDISGFVRRIAPRVRHAFLLGETKGVLATFCTAYRVSHTVCETLAEAVQGAAKLARSGEHVLLSPGFASFGLFRNYEDRGDQFEALVNNLGVTATLR